jgi:hypothetical protein
MNELDSAALTWRKSSRSAQGGDECVEVAELPGVIAVRDSKNPDGSVLAFGTSAFQSFVVAARSGSFDR